MEIYLIAIFAVATALAVLSVFASERASRLVGVQRRVLQHKEEIERQRRIEQAIAAASQNE